MGRQILAASSGPEWLEARTRGMGGTDTVTLMGAGQYDDETPYFVWLKKTEGYDVPDNPAMERGRALEPVVLDLYRDLTGNEVHETGLWQHEEHEMVLGSPDGLVLDVDGAVLGGVEAKTTLERTARDWDTDVCPPRYEWQARHYMAVVGAPWWDVIALVVDTWEVYRWRIERDEDKERALLAAAVGFWETYVVPGIAPEPDALMSAAEVAHRWADSTADVLDLDSHAVSGWQVAELVEERRALKAQAKDVDERLGQIDTELKSIAGEHEAVLLDGQQVYSWKPQSRQSVDVKRLREDYPDLAAELMRTTTFRRLTVK